jgi:phosphoribosylglycinamide formyltransferase-1
MLNRPEKLRVAVLVSGGGTNLQAILDARGTVIQNAEIVLVVSSQPNAYALERAGLAGIPAVTLSKKELGGQEAFEAALIRVLADYRVDLIVLAGFLTILSPEFARKYDRRIINVHPSLIPSFCGKGFYGLRVHEAALERGVKVTGATVHYVNEIPDGGEILLQKPVPVLLEDTPQTLQRRVMEQAEWILLPQAIEQIALQKSDHKQK